MTMRNDRIASDAIAITPSDTTVLNLCGLYVGGTGDVTVKGVSGVAVVFKSCPVGLKIDMTIIAVMSTGTTATLITGFVP